MTASDANSPKALWSEQTSPRLVSIPKNAIGRYYEALLCDAKIVAHACPLDWEAQDDHQRKDTYVQLCFQIDWGRRRCSSSDYATFRSRVLHAHKQSDARLFYGDSKKDPTAEEGLMQTDARADRMH